MRSGRVVDNFKTRNQVEVLKAKQESETVGSEANTSLDHKEAQVVVRQFR
jgi:hypothetical protein